MALFLPLTVGIAIQLSIDVIRIGHKAHVDKQSEKLDGRAPNANKFLKFCMQDRLAVKIRIFFFFTEIFQGVKTGEQSDKHGRTHGKNSFEQDKKIPPSGYLEKLFTSPFKRALSSLFPCGLFTYRPVQGFYLVWHRYCYLSMQ